MPSTGRIACLLFAGAALACISGCGTTPASTSSTPVATSSAANLSGNWLLAGVLPSFPAVGSSAGFGLTATFDVSGSQVIGIVTAQVSCSGFTSLGSGGVVSGTVAADGSFTLTSPYTSAGGGSVTLTGKAPTSAGGAWSGTYSLTQPSSTCSTNTTGTIAAASLPPVTGSYSGTASFASILGGTASPVSLKLVLQQGGAVTNVLGNSLQSNTVLTGTVTVQGSSCLTSGTTTATSLPGAVEGNTVLANFIMNDGSTLEMIGTTSTTDSSKLQVQFLTANTGACPAAFSGTTSLSR